MASIANKQSQAPRVIPETRPEMLKANLRKPENVDFLAQIGGCLDCARRDVGWTLEQLAAELKRDARQVRRWIDGSERCQVDVVFCVECLRGPFVIALARLADCCEITTVVTIRKSA